MRAVVQRVSRAEVRSKGRVLGRIGRGFMVLLGVADTDTDADAEFLADKITGLRVFADENGKMNLPIKAVDGAMLVVSQFTLLADTNSGRRPSFIHAAPPAEARRMYAHFVSLVRKSDVKVECGEFGAMMDVELTNDGPVTILFDTKAQTKE